jgi:flagellar hook-length control protein FliK
MNGQEFAGVMRELMAKGERQELAGTDIGEATDTATSALQTLNLGDQFSVITAASPLPDPDSLAQFARAQGLSEQAVQTLFGDLTSAPTTNTQLTQTGGLFGLPSNPLLASPLVTTPITDTSANDTLTLLPSAATLGWIQAHPGSLTISDQVATSAWAEAPHLASSVAGPKASDVSALMTAAGATGVLQALGGLVSSAPSQVISSADNLGEIPPELGPLDAMRMRLVPGWENMTRQLAQLKGSDQAAAWGQLTSNILNSKAECGECPEVLLDLGINDPSLMSALDALQDQNNNGLISLDSGRNTDSMGTLGASATNAAMANPEMTDRAAQIQDLADKLGKAMGERLQDQLERGEWKLQLKLNPANLGKIDVELDMSKAGLDAVFKTDNAVTRELIAQGMNKLKDSLAQSGMTVANVWVNSENQQKSGGNSTPRQNSGAETHTSTPVTEVAAAESRIKELRSSDAWDTLA